MEEYNSSIIKEENNKIILDENKSIMEEKESMEEVYKSNTREKSGENTDMGENESELSKDSGESQVMQCYVYYEDILLTSNCLLPPEKDEYIWIQWIYIKGLHLKTLDLVEFEGNIYKLYYRPIIDAIKGLTYDATALDRMHLQEIGLFPYMLNFTRDIIMHQSGNQIIAKMDNRLATITPFSGPKILRNGYQQEARFTGAEMQDVMKIIIFVLDELYTKNEDINLKIYAFGTLTNGEIVYATSRFYGQSKFSDVAVAMDSNDTDYLTDNGMCYGKILILAEIILFSKTLPIALIHWISTYSKMV
ncbi:hypothetical protein RhiirA4_430970 [Rhizophagus irregularis]|uniref:Uncharacterized protein n=1 Tax=Rhizophagus irregularis TaxID=588596 RepID=A0A2I1HMX3_9GLOM|nr:hypothetical protein RhiirA4_430970 [Rhizophagus irregularis]